MSTQIRNATQSVRCLSSLLVRAPRKGQYAATRATKRQKDLARHSPLPWRRNILGIAVGEKSTNREPIEGQFCLKFFVREKLAKSRIPAGEMIPEVITLDSIETEVLTDLERFPGIPIAQSDERVRPLRPGSSVGHYLGGTNGTLGLIVKRRGSDRPMILSCSHVLALGGRVDPDDPHENAIEQPADFDTEVGPNRVGRLSDKFTQIRVDAINQADAALAEIDDGLELSRSIPEIGEPKGVSQLFEEGVTRLSGVVVSRHGVKTGFQTGSLLSIEATFPILYRVLGDRVAFFERLVLYKTICAPGDSGAAVLDSQTKEVMGLHVAGTGDFGMFTPIQIVLDAVDADLF